MNPELRTQNPEPINNLSDLLKQLGFNNKIARIRFVQNATGGRSYDIADYSQEQIQSAIDQAQIILNNRNNQWLKIWWKK